MPITVHPTRPSSVGNDEMVVLQLLEEIHHLILPNASGVSPSTLRLQAAAKLYLDTRDAFETIERDIDDIYHHGRPKLQRKLSKRRTINASPRDAAPVSTTSPEDAGAARGAGTSYTGRSHIETDHVHNGSLTARSEPPSRRPSVSESSIVEDTASPSDGLHDRIQTMFRHLGDKLSRAILDELRHRNVPLPIVLHYVRFLPPDAQWTAYMEKRDDEVRVAYNPLQLHSETLLQQLKRNAEFIKEQIRKDVNTVCLFAADGTLSTIFGDDLAADAAVVAEKFEGLIRDVYARYLFSIIKLKMDQLLRVSDQWQQDMAVLGASPVTTDAPHAHLFVRSRKFRSKIPIFPHAITAIDNRASTAVLPSVAPGHPVRVLVADLNHLGVWWQKTILAATDRDVTTSHTDDSRGIAGVNASLDGQIYVPLQFDNANDFLRRHARHGGLAKWLGHRLLVNNGKDSLWVEVTVVEVEDNKRWKLQLKKAIENVPETRTWQQLLATHEWLQFKDLKLCMAPLNPHFRIHMGLKLHGMIDVFQSLVIEISSIFPNEDLEHRVGKSLWQAVEPSFGRGEHVYARYFRSVLNQELQAWRPAGTHPHPHTHTALERSSSLTLASASVRNLVAALEHSALATNGTGSISAPSTAGSPLTPYTPTPRRLSLSGQSTSNLLGRSVDSAFFDDKGVYHYQLVLPDPPLRVNAVGSFGANAASPFEKLAHHLLEEKEIVGACIQNNNIALGRAFAQVLQEKLTRLTKQLQLRLEQDATCAIEVVLTEYASACRFLYTWHIVRYELDTVAKQRRNHRDHVNTIHAEWVDRSFQRMEALVLTMLRLQRQYLQRMCFHELTSHTLPGVCAQDWTSSKPWFGHSRCTYAIQFVLFRMQTLFDGGVLRLLVQYERALSVHEKVHEMASWLVVDLVACVASLYESLIVSRARMVQWKMDILYFVVGVHKLLRLLERMLSPKTVHAHQNGRGCTKTTIEIRKSCLRLLACLAVRTGPANAVTEELHAKLTSDPAPPVDVTTELEAHVTAIRTAMSVHRAPSVLALDEEDTSPWTSHSVFGDVELKHLATVELNWASLLARSSLSTEALLTSLQHRHELGDWAYPPLTDEQTKARTRLQACVSHVEAHLQHLRDVVTTPGGQEPLEITSPSRAETPDVDVPTASSRRMSLKGPAANGVAEDHTSLLANHPFRVQSGQLPLLRPGSVSTSPRKPSQPDIAIAAVASAPSNPLQVGQGDIGY